MTQPLPPWIQLIQAFATPLIALMLAAIGYFQWRTAHHKMLLDLFDKRMNVYGSIRRVVADVLHKPYDTHSDHQLDFAKASADAIFLFGPEVNQKLNEINIEIGILAAANKQTQGTIEQELLDKSAKSLSMISCFYMDLPALTAPYMRMNQKLPHSSMAAIFNALWTRYAGIIKSTSQGLTSRVRALVNRIM